ncbi:MAG: hypothetical protein ACLT8A_06110 [Subdoligranulum sp.]
MLDKTSSIICAFGLASAAPRSPYRHLKLCGIAFIIILTHAGEQCTPPGGCQSPMLCAGAFSCASRRLVLQYWYILQRHCPLPVEH